MSFLNAIFLMALPIAAAPIVLHLLRRRHKQTISWGAMQFLTDAVCEGRRFDRLEEWLLLALRTTVLLALVLALARPLVRGLVPQAAAVGDVLVVIDDSLSTDRPAAGGQVYELIRQRAREFLEERGEGEGIRLMLAAEGPRWLVEQPVAATTAGKAELIAALDGVEPTRGAANFLNCLRLAAALDTGEEKDIERRVVVFTDGQEKGWAVEARGVWSRLHNAIEQSGRHVHFEVVAVDVPEVAQPNRSVDRVTASRNVAAEHEMVTFAAHLSNTGIVDAPALSMTWKVDGKRQADMDIPPLAAGQSTSLVWRTVFDKRGVHDVSAAIESADMLTLDNEAGSVVEIVEAVPILILVPQTGLEAEENTFLAAATGYDEDRGDEQTPAASRWRSLYRPTFVRFGDAAKENFSKYHAVVVSSLGELPPEAIEKLDGYVREGGGLWLMLGARLDRDEFNRRWYADGAGLCPLPLASLVRPSDRDSAEATIHPPAGDHPTTVVLADTDHLDIDRVRLHRYYTFGRQAGQESTALLETGLGAPLVLLEHVGKGHVIVQAYPLRTDWTDLAISKSFVVMVQDWLSYLTQPAATRYNLVAREPFVYQLGDNADVNEATIKLPDGSKVEIKPVDRGDGAAFRFSQTSLPGRYEIQFTEGKEKHALPFRVARDPAESNYVALTVDDKTMLRDAAGVHFEGPEIATTAPTSTARRLEPAWWPLLVAMVCLMAAESLLAARVSRGRFGSIRAEAAA